MAEDRDLEQQLDRMFSSAVPRHGFERELWQRLSARPWYRRLPELLAGPALLRAGSAVAVLLVVVGGGLWLQRNVHLNFGGGSTSTASAPTDSGASAQKAAAASFGTLPAAGARPIQVSTQPALGPEALVGSYGFVGTVPALPSSLPVYRFDEPAGNLASVPQLTVAGAVTQQSDPVATADAFLASHGLTPRFHYQAVVSSSGDTVTYVRYFDVPGGSAPLVGDNGLPAGLTVRIQGGQATVVAPASLSLASAAYPLRPSSEALSSLPTAAVPGGSAQIRLSSAQLVYVAVSDAVHGYYVPELLLTGSGAAVLVPIVSPQWLAP